MTADVVVPLVVVSGFAVFSVLGLFFATRVGRSMSRFARVARPTSGRIVSIRSVPGQQRPLDHYPVLRFRLPDGEEVETVSFATTSRRRASDESVVVMYDPEDPRKAALKDLLRRAVSLSDASPQSSQRSRSPFLPVPLSPLSTFSVGPDRVLRLWDAT